ncbi:hypothetical protein [Parvibaculum sp.]|uniref:hypothetical protein n=1 Tax=Parvibaculum sp. TaxID=2024848 RepID=UPI00391CB5E6
MQHPQRDATGQGNKSVASRNIVTGASAAKELGINRSTLTRYLKTYPELNRSKGEGSILVDLDELRRHRAENVNRMKSGNHAGRLYDEAPPPLLPPRTQVERDDEDDETTEASLQDETVAKIRARAERIKLNRLEREEATETGQLTPAAEVEEATGNALVKLRDALMSPDLDLCEKLAATSDPAEVTQILRDANRKALEKLAEDFENDAQRGGAA